jgi:hypothetical protein
MVPIMPEIDIGAVSSRRDMVRFLDGYSLERKEELDERKSKRPLVKTQLLEVLDGSHCRPGEDYSRVFERRGLRLKVIDHDLYGVRDDKGQSIGFLERLSPRIVALYSMLESKHLTPAVRRVVIGSSELDWVWLSGLTFSVLWGLVVKLSPPSRFAKLVFTHHSVYEVDEELEEADTEEELTEPQEESEDTATVIERRAARFQLIDRIHVVSERLGALQRTYSPLYAISQLRFPSPAGRGGHDFYENGRVTNRSVSFRDHRLHVLFVSRIYEQLLGRTERQAWYSVQTSLKTPGEFRKIIGAPLTVQFVEPLSTTTFEQWIKSTFERSRNRFRLWGHPIRLGPTKVHVYGLDRHLWQPIFLELTAKGCLAIIPNGTCGNTVQRLVTNIQRYLDPSAKVFLGGQRYEEMVQEASTSISYDSLE